MSDAAAWRRPASVRRDYAVGRYGQLHYRFSGRAGQRPPVLFLHASPTSGRHYEPVLAALGSDRFVLAPDTPGFGDSDAPPSPPGIEDYAAALGEFVDGLGLPRVDVVGYHTGSKIACELALQRPALVRRLALVSASVYTAEELARQRRDFADPGVPRDGSHIAARWAFLNRWCKPDVPLIVRQKAVAEYLKSGPLAHWGHRAAFAYAHADNLPLLRHRVLVFNFDDDLHEQTARAGRLLRNGLVQDLPWAHGSIEVRADEFARHLRAHFDAPGDDGLADAAAKPVPPPPALAPAPVRRRFLNANGRLVHLREAKPAGRTTATPLVLLHATPDSGRMFEDLLPEVGRARRVIALDLPGHGESDALESPATVAHYADAVGAALWQLDIDAVDIGGCDLGALVAVETALRRPGKIRRLVLAGAPHVPPAGRAAAHAANLPLGICPDGSHDSARYAALRASLPDSVPDCAVAREFAESLRGGPMAWWGRRAAIDYDLPARRALLRCDLRNLPPATLDAPSLIAA